MFICRTSVQQLFVEDMGVEAGIYAVMEWEAARDEYFEALEIAFERLIELINRCPIRIINFGDNIHASTLSPAWFERFILPVYQRRCELLHRGGNFVTSHWDGNVKPILKVRPRDRSGWNRSDHPPAAGRRDAGGNQGRARRDVPARRDTGHLFQHHLQ
jgi:hypothetical protein